MGQRQDLIEAFLSPEEVLKRMLVTLNLDNVACYGSCWGRFDLLISSKQKQKA